MSIDLDESTLAKLARELVMNIRNYKEVFEDYGIDESDYYQIEKNDYFKKVKEQLAIEWNATMSTKDRVQLGSLAYVEQLLPVVTRRALREDTPLAASIETGKLLSKIAGIGESKTDKPNLDRFVITINMGADVEHYDKPIAVEEPIPVIKSEQQKVIRPKKETGNGKADS